MANLITLYHGTSKKLNVVKANSINYGTVLSKPRYSSFWVDEQNKNFAKIFAIVSLIMDYQNKKGVEIPLMFAVENDTMYRDKLIIDDHYKRIVTDMLNKGSCYLCQKTIDKSLIGYGHVSNIPEYTIDFDVKPDKIITLYYKDFTDIICFEPTSHILNLRSKMDSFKYNTKFNGNNLRKLFLLNDNSMQKREKAINKYLSSL